MEAPVRSDYPAGSAGQKQYNAAVVKYKKYIKDLQDNANNTELNYAPIIPLVFQPILVLVTYKPRLGLSTPQQRLLKEALSVGITMTSFLQQLAWV